MRLDQSQGIFENIIDKGKSLGLQVSIYQSVVPDSTRMNQSEQLLIGEDVQAEHFRKDVELL